MTPTGPASSAQPVFGSATAVLELAVSGRWRSPETTAALADHAVVQARTEGDSSCALLAEGWLLHGLAAVGRGPAAVVRAVAALSDAVRVGHRPAEARLRVGLAVVARELGDQDSARALLGPVLSSDISDPELAADAYIEAVRGGGPGLPAAVELAVGHIRRLRGEQVELGLAALDAALANRHRTDGDPGAAAARAREGLRRLLGDPGAGSELDPISPHIAAWLSLELTLSLFDDGQPDLARRVAEPALAWSGRPAALVPLTRLRLTLAQRAYLPVGENEAALRSVAWAAGVVGEQDLPGLEADCQSLLAEVQEQRGALPDALTAIRRAHQALRVHSLRVEQALVLLGRSAADPRRSPSPEGLAPGGPRPDAQTLGLPPVGGPPPGPSAPDRDAISASGAFAAASPTVRLPIVPPRPAHPGADEQPVRGPGPSAADEPSPARPGPNGVGDPAPWSGSGAVEDPAAAWPGTSVAEPHRPGTAADQVEDGWSGLTGWPEAIRTKSPGAASGAWSAGGQAGPVGVADALTVAAQDRPAGIGPEALGWAEAGGWDDLPGSASATPPAGRRSGLEFDAGAGAESAGFHQEPRYTSMPEVGPATRPVDDPDLSTAGFGPLSGDVHPHPEDGETDAGSELDELFEPGESRPLGLVALDVATPTGPLTGDAVRRLLERVAEHVQGQLPPNSRLAVLARDAVLVVLPPVEPEVVARWMRSLAGGLSARWSEYAADAPRSAFRVAVGALEPGRAPVDTVADLCDRLSRQSTAATGSAGGGRHVARARATVEMNAGAAATDSRSGGRRRRPENGAPPGSAPAAAPGSAASPPAPEREKPPGSTGNGRAPSAHTNGVPPGATGPVGVDGPDSAGRPVAGPECGHDGRTDAAGGPAASTPNGARWGSPLAPDPGLNGSPRTALGGLPDRSAALHGRPIGVDGAGALGPARYGWSTTTDVAPGPSGSPPRRGGVTSRTAGLDRAAVARLSGLASHPPMSPGTAPGAARAGFEVTPPAVRIRADTFYAAATERIVMAAALATALTARSEPAGSGAGAATTAGDPRPGTWVPSGDVASGDVASGDVASGDVASGDVASDVQGPGGAVPGAGDAGEAVLDAAASGPATAAEPVPDAARSSTPTPTPVAPAEPAVQERGARPDARPKGTDRETPAPSRAADPVRAHVPTAELSFAELLAGALAAYRDG